MKNVVILGATGSIGSQALDYIKLNPTKFRLLGATCGKDIFGLLRIAKEFSPKYVGIGDESLVPALTEELKKANLNVEVLPPESVASLGSADVVLSAVVGIGGLTCAVKALEAGKKLALANKEVVVTAGRLLKNIAKKSGGELIPVDSEHSAIFQCLKLGDKKELSSVTLTASGGAFRDFDQKMLETVTPEMATTHPVWKMGKKVTVDSATLMNKGLEVVEAARFFDLPASKIKVLMHRESVIHGMASFTDGSVVAVLGKPDMRVPIGLSLSWPERFETGVKPPDLSDYGELHFSKPDFEKYSSLRLAYEAEDKGEIAVIAMSAADEVAVKLFLDQKISFTDIPRLVSVAVESAETGNAADFNDVLSIDRYTREYILKKAGF